MFRVFALLLIMTCCGCAGTEQYIFCGNDCKVYCVATVDKPVSTSTLPIDLKARDVTVPFSAIP